VRTITPYTSELVRAEGIEPTAEFPAYMDFAAFTGPAAPSPREPRAVFVGVLERYKAFDVLAEAWRRVVADVPDATLHVVGRGRLEPVARELVADLPSNVAWDRVLAASDVAGAIDAARVLVLPSRSEGMGRVVIEAGLRGRPLVGSRVGGIPDVARDGETAVLVEPGDARALADALTRVLTEPDLAERLGESAQEQAQRWLVSPEEYAKRIRGLVDRVAE
jgi:glycosyltransferase involved in cell wall biosynthesis